jgi:hypothetical protein
LSVVDSGAPPPKWGVFAVQDVAEGCPRRVVAIRVIRRGGGCNPTPRLEIEIQDLATLDRRDFPLAKEIFFTRE